MDEQIAEPDVPEILYHYCTTDTFVSIVTHGSIRLSSMTLSNDSLEGRLVHRLLMDIAAEDKLDATASQQLEAALLKLHEVFDGLAFCLSEEPDLLSQWRGYSADGTGVCLGLRTDQLIGIGATTTDYKVPGFRLRQVIYDADTQLARLRPTYQSIAETLKSGQSYPTLLGYPDAAERKAAADRWTKNLQQMMLQVLVGTVGQLYVMKTRAFREEREWRLLGLKPRTLDTHVDYRSAGNRIVPFQSYSFIDRPTAIAEVVLGPKHLTPISTIGAMLEKLDYGKVPVRQSEATYR